MDAGLVVELLTIGNEVLLGDVLDTNSHWLCRELALRGARVRRITVVPDVQAVIAETLLASLERRPAAVITCGGLGPTVDDLTAESVAVALSVPLKEDETAVSMIREFYAALHARGEVAAADVTPARRKMAQLPAGSRPLPNSVGAAPGILVETGDVLLACLPGVPAEMKAIFTEQLWPLLSVRSEASSGMVFAERVIQTDSHDESAMAPAVDAVAARHPRVYVKSRAQVYGGEATDFVTLSVRAITGTEAQGLLDAAEADLRAGLAALGVRAL